MSLIGQISGHQWASRVLTSLSNDFALSDFWSLSDNKIPHRLNFGPTFSRIVPNLTKNRHDLGPPQTENDIRKTPKEPIFNKTHKKISATLQKKYIQDSGRSF